MTDIAVPSAATATSFRTTPSDRAIQRATAASSRVRDRDAPVRRAFIRSGDTQPPPVAHFLRGGRGGEVRLKLYLSLLWIASNDPYETRFPSAIWAELMDLPDPDHLGARRVKDAIDWLEDQGFVRTERRPGWPSMVYLLRETGGSQPYEHPARSREPYVRLPAGFWSNGWLACLSGRAIALLLILLDNQDYRNPSEPFWVSPRWARDTYALSADTWTRGTQELREHGLIEVSRIPVSEEFGFSRLRNRYVLSAARLASAPCVFALLS